MLLNARMVLFHLSKNFPCTVSSSISSEPVLKYPVIYETGRPLTDGLIYLVDTPYFRLPSHHLANVLFIFLPGTRYPDIESLPNLCVVRGNVSTAGLLHFLQEIFQKYQEWDQQAFSLIYTNPSVQELLELTSKILPHPMLIHDQSFTVLGSHDLELGELKNNVYGSSKETLSVLTQLKRDPIYPALADKEGCWLYSTPDKANTALCCNIHIYEKFFARFLIYPGEYPLDETIFFLVNYISTMLEHILSTRTLTRTDAEPLMHRIFQSILTNPETDYVACSQQLNEQNWHTTDTYLCVVIKTGTADWENMTLNSICNYVENIIPGACAVEHKGNAVVFINQRIASMYRTDIGQLLAEFVRDSFLIAGYSRSMHGHMNFYRQYIQALHTIQLGSAKNPTAWIHHFDDIAMEYILDRITGRLPSYMIANERLLKLKYLDEASHSHLYETLRSYLENNQSATRTAEALYIHRSTLLYRLEKIREIMKTDFSDPAEVLYLLISYSIIEKENQPSR